MCDSKHLEERLSYGWSWATSVRLTLERMFRRLRSIQRDDGLWFRLWSVWKLRLNTRFHCHSVKITRREESLPPMPAGSRLHSTVARGDKLNTSHIIILRLLRYARRSKSVRSISWNKSGKGNLERNQLTIIVGNYLSNCNLILLVNRHKKSVDLLMHQINYPKLSCCSID